VNLFTDAPSKPCVGALHTPLISHLHLHLPRFLMRTFSLIGCVSLCGMLATFTTIACQQEDPPPNPPATRNGTEDTPPAASASLPGTSDPTVGQKPASSSSSSSSSGASSTSSSSGGTSSSSGTPALPNGPTSGVDETKKLSELNATEKAQLCDWEAGILGGYNHKTTCSGGSSTTNAASQSACVSKMPATCEATVQEIEDCSKIDAKDPCAFAILTAPECKPLLACSQ